ncbi:hypothetical protein C4J95_3171 [Pseudomonas orientalis]|nr:hypothetical protein C4J96_2991 [Pseudomonas orientalis]AZF00632.1 hypothetical protein C4J95_3171 [Pseudomonas orientalis]
MLDFFASRLRHASTACAIALSNLWFPDELLLVTSLFFYYHR